VEHVTRRAFLAAAAALPLAGQTGPPLTSQDARFLEDLSKRAFRYFWEQADPNTGLVLDRTPVDGSLSKRRSANIASMASTGFGLTALSIAYQRRWMDAGAVRERVRRTLSHFAYDQPHYLGWFYHFVDRRTGERAWDCELSTIDTALLLAGVLTAQQCFFDDPDIPRLAQEIFDRVDFLWMLDPQTELLRMGWKPGTGFLRSVWAHYRENVILHMLAMASRTHPIPLPTWYRFGREQVVFEDYAFVGSGPLFTHQFPQAWLHLDGLCDGPPYEIDYFQNSVVATRAHRAYCLSLRSDFPSYSENLWGMTPSDSDIGYVIWGAMVSRSRRNQDGTVVPCAAGGSLMFTPELCLPALHAMYDQFGSSVYGRYGFADAFNPWTGWVDSQVLGINLGITLLGAENLRTQQVWNWFMSSPDIRKITGRVFHPSGDLV
jgi:hypothetical protein